MALPTLALVLLLRHADHELPLVAPPAPETTLDALYLPDCARPGEFVGFSFLDPLPELSEAAAVGANSGLANWMWIPTLDPASPSGMAGPPIHGLIGASRYAQEVTTTEPFTALGLALPAYVTEGAPVYLRAYRNGEEIPTASAFIERPRDNEPAFVPGDFEPGGYWIEVELASSGPGRVGVWARPGDRPAATANGQSMTPLHLEALGLRADDSIAALYDEGAPHMALELTGDLLQAWRDLGLQIGIYVGNWNNGGFPYYPDWFYERFPDAAMLDQFGQPFLSGMFDRQVPWLGISHPAIVEGTSAHIESSVRALAPEEALRYWVLGGESLYYTYLLGARLTDYSPYALNHLRGWLSERYHGDLAALNDAWDTNFTSWAQVTPPVELGRNAASVDFALFRFQEMAERFGWHYQSVRAADPGRLALSCNHGTLFEGRSYFGLGLDPAALAAATDGFELGQIMRDHDGSRYNLLWMYSVMGYGKPLAAPRLAYAKTDLLARGGGTSYTPEAARRYFGEAIGTGCWHTGFVQWYGDLPDGEWGVRGTPAEAEFRAIFKEWHQIEREFDSCWPIRPRIGMLRSRPTWAVEGHPRIWQALHEELVTRGLGYLPLSGEMSWEGLDAVICADNPILEHSDRERLAALDPTEVTILTLGENGILDEACREAADISTWPGVRSIPADGMTIAERARALADAAADRSEDGFRIVLHALEPITRELTSSALMGGHDRPLDLAGGPVEQVFTPTEDGLRVVAVSVPTFAQEYQGGPLRLLVTDAAGATVGESSVEARALKDNAWHEVAMEAACPAGQPLRLTIQGPDDLAPLRLGVWSSASVPTEGGGPLSQGGQGIGGSLEMRARYVRAGTAQEIVEVFRLSDGAGAVVVLVNTGDVPVRFSLLNPESLALDSVYPLAVRRLDAARRLGDDVVPAHQTAFVAIHRDVPPAAVQSWLTDLMGQFGEVSAERGVLLDRAWEALAAGMPHKALAHGLAAARWLDTDLEARVEGDTLVIRASPQAAHGADASGLTLEASLVPLGGPAIRLEPTEDGAYEARIALDAMPKRYDYREGRYERAWGPVQVELRARAGALRGGERVTVELPRLG